MISAAIRPHVTLMGKSISNHYIKQLLKRTHSSFFPSEELILKHTAISNSHLTPEIKLRLITRDTETWFAPVEPSSPHPLGEPFWAFYWPGGQGISRYILDHPELVKGKRVLDFGCGSGVNAIASLICGAKEALANDIDPLALVAAKLNADLNGVNKLTLSGENLLGTDCAHFDVVLIGDMMYDSCLAERIFKWCLHLNSGKRTVLIGDPGRLPMEQSFSWHGSKLCTVAKYELDCLTKGDNLGFSCAFVYRLL